MQALGSAICGDGYANRNDVLSRPMYACYFGRDSKGEHWRILARMPALQHYQHVGMNYCTDSFRRPGTWSAVGTAWL